MNNLCYSVLISFSIKFLTIFLIMKLQPLLFLQKTLVWILPFILFSSSFSCQRQIKPPKTFSFHIPRTPQSFDPLLYSGLGSRYLLTQLYQPLLKWNAQNQLVPAAAENCYWRKKNLTCKIKKNLKFEDGTPIEAQHFKNTYELLKQKTHPDWELIKDIQIDFISPKTIQFKPSSLNYRLKEHLTRLSFSPRKEKKIYHRIQDIISSTSYRVIDFKKDQWVLLKKIFHDIKVKIYFIEDSSTALRLFESGLLDLMRGLPVREINRYKESPQFFSVTMARMDSIIFSKDISKNEDFRKALIYSLSYKDLQKIYHSLGKPGCPSLPRSFYTQDQCYSLDLDQALKHWKKVPKPLKIKSYHLSFSVLGGEDIQKGMEWMAYQWKKKLGLNIQIEPLESGHFFHKLNSKEYDILRKGLPLDTPSCFEALSLFTLKSPNNFIQFQSPLFETLIQNLKSSHQVQPSDCNQGLSLLMASHKFIPLGEMYFSYLDNKKYTGWFINSLDILDLTELTPTPSL